VVRVRNMSERLYFNLVSTQESLPDCEGVEVDNVRHAQAAAVAMLDELLQEDASAARDWSGWTLSVTDRGGRVLFSIDLSLAGYAQGRASKIDRGEKRPRREKLVRRGQFPRVGGDQARSRGLPIAGRKGPKT
jgi:hypothetical protein